jgi:hypothetical protein
MMMVILDNDLANVIQAERRQYAAHERLHHESIGPARDQSRLFSLYRVATGWLGAQAAVLPPGVSAGRRREQRSI